MKIKRMLCVLTALLLLCVDHAFAETRNIYIGDIITLEVKSQKLSEEELREKFQDFEIVDIKKESDGYLLSIRTFDTGERIILLGDKEIVINVASALEDIQREDIFEGESDIIEPGFAFHWQVLFYIATGVFVLSGGLMLVKTLKKRGIKPESPYKLFLRRSAALSAEEDNYFVDLTFYFKEYLESLYKRRIIGKTSTEIVKELKEIHALEAMLSNIQKWLTECDMLKFSGVEASGDEKQRHYTQLLDIAEKIEMNQYDINEGMA